MVTLVFQVPPAPPDLLDLIPQTDREDMTIIPDITPLLKEIKVTPDPQAELRLQEAGQPLTSTP